MSIECHAAHLGLTLYSQSIEPHLPPEIPHQPPSPDMVPGITDELGLGLPMLVLISFSTIMIGP